MTKKCLKIAEFAEFQTTFLILRVKKSFNKNIQYACFPHIR